VSKANTPIKSSREKSPTGASAARCLSSDLSQQQQTHLMPGKDLMQFPPRQRILAAALKLFVEQGYFNTNVPDLSRESKCSVGSIYHNFRSKEDVAKALYEEGIGAFRQALYSSLPDGLCAEKTTTCLTLCVTLRASAFKFLLSSREND
jgi:hypothetical protein